MPNWLDDIEAHHKEIPFNAIAYTIKYQHAQRLINAVKISEKALKEIKECWDISDPTSVVPAFDCGNPPRRNDSCAAGSIVACVQALEQIEAIGRLESEGK